MNGEAANADTAGPYTLHGAVRLTGKSVACPSRRAQQQGESLVRTVGEVAVGLGHVAELGPQRMMEIDVLIRRAGLRGKSRTYTRQRHFSGVVLVV